MRKKIIFLAVIVCCCFMTTKIMARSNSNENTAVVSVKNYLLSTDGTETMKYDHSDSVTSGNNYSLASAQIDGYNQIGFVARGVYQTSDKLRITKDTTIKSYYVPTGYKAAILCSQGYKVENIQVSSNGELDTTSINTINSLGNYEALNTYSVVYNTDYVNVYMRDMSPLGSYTVSVIGGTASSSSIIYDNTVTVTSTTENFTCWKVNDKIVSYQSTYTFSVYSDTTIVASTDNVTATPFINYTNIGDSIYVCHFELSNYEFVEAGMIFGGTTFEAATKQVGAKRISTNNEFAIKYTGSTTCNAYLVYQDIAGTYYTIMANNADLDIYSTNTIYASPSGSGSGTYASPYSLTTAISNLNAGDTLYLLEGTYVLSANIKLSKVGNEEAYTKIFAYNGASVIFDYDAYRDSATSYTYNSSSYIGITITGSYYHLKGIQVDKAGSKGISVEGDNNIVEGCILSENGNSGLQIAGSSSDTIENWPASNLILNCSSYGNYDYSRDEASQGEDADGFAAKLTCGYNNVFDGCMAFNNSDDGWDLFTKRETGPIGAVTIKNSIAFNNGYGLDGVEIKNGNGFKLGGRALEVDHIVDNCLAFSNKGNGFDDNSNPGTITATNCTSYNNGIVSGRNFAMGRFTEETNTYTSTWTENGVSYGPINGVNGSHNVFENILSYNTLSNTTSDNYRGTAAYSYFVASKNGGYYRFTNSASCNYNVSASRGTSYSNSVSPFVNLTLPTLAELTSLHEEWRASDGTIALGDFMKVTSTFAGLGKNGGQLGCDLSGTYDSEEAIAAYNTALANIPTPITNNVSVYEKIIICENAYSALSSEDKATVDYATLQTYRNSYNQSVADSVIALINDIGTVDANSEADITAAELAYSNLNSNQKALVTNYETLTTARSTYNTNYGVVSFSLQNDIDSFTLGEGTASTSTTYTYNSVTYSTIYKLIGSLNATNNRYIGFTVTKACTVKVVCISSNTSTARPLAIGSSSTGTGLISSQEVSTIAELEFTITAAGTYYIYSTNSGINVYDIIIE